MRMSPRILVRGNHCVDLEVRHGFPSRDPHAYRTQVDHPEAMHFEVQSEGAWVVVTIDLRTRIAPCRYLREVAHLCGAMRLAWRTISFHR